MPNISTSVHVYQLNRSVHNSTPPSCRATAIEALRAWPGGLHMGGGVTADNALEYLDAGASHVIVTSYVFREGRLEEERLAKLVRLSTFQILHEFHTDFEYCAGSACVCASSMQLTAW